MKSGADSSGHKQKLYSQEDSQSSDEINRLTPETLLQPALKIPRLTHNTSFKKILAPKDKSFQIYSDNEIFQYTGNTVKVATFHIDISLAKRALRALLKRIKIFKFSNITQLFIHFSGGFDTQDKGIEILTLIIKPFSKRLEKLELTFTLCFLTDKGLEKIGFEICRGLSNLKYFSIGFNVCDGVTYQGLKMFKSAICEGLAKLESLSISLSSYSKITQKGATMITTDTIRCSPHLSKIAINLSRTALMTDYDLKLIGSKIDRNLDRIQELKLAFNNCPNISDNAVSAMISQMGPKIAKLRHLSLNLDECYSITDKGLKDVVFKSFSYFKNLEELGLSFKKCFKITNAGISDIGNCIGENFPQLLGLSLNFNGCQIGDEAIQPLTQQANTFQNKLEYLSLNFGLSKATSKSLEELSSVICKIKSLKDLNLVFSMCTDIQYTMKQKVTNEIINLLPSLKSITII